ncbi:MAG: sulfatase [Victivallaceae bacterium]|nr:sulfatase [Victivallaceae bacterium]
MYKNLITALGVTAAITATNAAVPEKKPNVILITIDDLNDWVGSMKGHPQTITPNIDALAKRGVLFSNAHCPATICGPSRTAMLFGIRSSRSGIYSNNQNMRDSPVLKNAVTMPQYFKNNGYNTQMYGKVFDLVDPDPRSWNSFWPSKDRWRKLKGNPEKIKQAIARVKQKQANYKNWPGPPVMTPGKKIHAGSPAKGGDETMFDFKTVSMAEKYLAKKHNKPFFLAVGIYKPHSGWSVPKKYHDKFPVDKIIMPPIKEDDLDDVPPISRQLTYTEGLYKQAKKQGKIKKSVANYLACINFADTMVGKLLKSLQQSRYADNTVIIVWGDNGYHLGSKKRIHKGTLWERSTRIPLIFAGPGIPKGEVIKQAVDSVNIYPTVANLCGLKEKKGLDGINMVPLMKNPQMKWDYPAITSQLGKHHAVRSNRYRYIRYSDGSEELYDHSKDPNEWNNLAGNTQYAAIKKKLRKYIPSTKNMPDVAFALPKLKK